MGYHASIAPRIAHLMARGLTVAGGDRFGKTILFAKNQAHADFIAERFNANYPHFEGEFARAITFKTEYAQSLINNFSKTRIRRPRTTRWAPHSASVCSRHGWS